MFVLFYGLILLQTLRGQWRNQRLQALWILHAADDFGTDTATSTPGRKSGKIFGRHGAVSEDLVDSWVLTKNHLTRTATLDQKQTQVTTDTT